MKKIKSFTLVEVLAALCVFSIASIFLLPGIYKLTSHNIDNSKMKELNLKAFEVIENIKSRHFIDKEIVSEFNDPDFDISIENSETDESIEYKVKVTKNEKSQEYIIYLPKETRIYSN